MIGTTQIGSMGGGRLGNQMYSYASSKGIACMNGQGHCFTEPRSGGVSQLLQCFDIPNINIVPQDYFTDHRGPKSTVFDEELLHECEDRTAVGSYYLQTDKYFKHIEKEIKADFKFKQKHVDASQKWRSYFNQDVIGLHVRRKDYLWKNVHQTTPCITIDEDMGYYDKCLQSLPKNIPVMVFTDSKKWCRSNDYFKHKRFRIINGNTFTDLYLMTLCKYHIISNSTYSWWGAYLSESNKILAPKRWYGNQSLAEEMSKSQIPEGGKWIRVEY